MYNNDIEFVRNTIMNCDPLDPFYGFNQTR